MLEFQGRLGIVQRVLPRYRAPFFDLLAGQCQGGLSLFAGEARPSEAITPVAGLEVANLHPARNRHLLGGPLYLCWQSGLLDWLEMWDPGVLVVEANPRYLSTSSALRWMRARNRPVLSWGLGTSAGWLAPLRRAFLNQFDALVAYSQRGAEQYRQLGFERVFVVPNAAAPRPSGHAPQRPPIKGPAVVLFVGRLQTRKRLDNLLRACAALPEAVQPQVSVVGDGPARPALEAFARKTYPQAEFQGPLYGTELDEAFQAADLFVLPGTGGLAVQQAMAHGLPVIVAEGDGTQADLVSAANGWLVPANDDVALLAALIDALRDPDRLRTKGRVSFELVQTKYNLENMVDEFISAINQAGS